MILFSVFCETDRWSRVNGEADEIKCGQVEEDIRVNSSPIQYAISLSTLITASYLVLCSMSVFFYRFVFRFILLSLFSKLPGEPVTGTYTLISASASALS